MKNPTLLLSSLAVVLIGTAGFGVYRAGMQHGLSMHAAPVSVAGTPPAMQPASKHPADDRKILYWHDPMVPGQKFDKPGKSPFMDMQLVPVYASEDAAGDAGSQVRIDPAMQQNLGMRTAVVGSSVLAAAIDVTGSIAYDERDVAVVQARSNGFVERLYLRAPLDTVRRGQPLAELYVPEWLASQEEYLSVKRMGQNTPPGLLSAARGRMRLVGMTEEQIRLVESRGSTRTRITIGAPIDGVVTELSVRDGMTVMAGAPLFRINGLRTVWLNADVPENAAARIRPGDAVEARSPALPGLTFKGKVGALLPDINAQTRTVKVRIELANPGGQLVPGMFASIHMLPAGGGSRLAVPSEAIIKTGTRSIVMLAQDDNRFVPAAVETGIEANGLTEITRGLKSGQKVVVSGQFLIDSEASLKGIAAPAPAAAAMDMPPAAPTPAGPLHHGVGKVEKIGPDEVTLSHGPIPSLHWGPMTMGFKAPAGIVPKGLAVGDTAGFDIRAGKDGMYEIVTITPQPGSRK